MASGRLWRISQCSAAAADGIVAVYSHASAAWSILFEQGSPAGRQHGRPRAPRQTGKRDKVGGTVASHAACHVETCYCRAANCSRHARSNVWSGSTIMPIFTSFGPGLLLRSPGRVPCRAISTADRGPRKPGTEPAALAIIPAWLVGGVEPGVSHTHPLTHPHKPHHH